MGFGGEGFLRLLSLLKVASCSVSEDLSDQRASFVHLTF